VVKEYGSTIAAFVRSKDLEMTLEGLKDVSLISLNHFGYHINIREDTDLSERTEMK